MVGTAIGQHLADQRTIAVHPLHLVERPLVLLQAQPGQPFQNGGHRLGGGAFHIGVLDAQHIVATEVPGKGPGIEGRAHPANVQETGGAGCKAGTHPASGCSRSSHDVRRYENGWEIRTLGGADTTMPPRSAGNGARGRGSATCPLQPCWQKRARATGPADSIRMADTAGTSRRNGPMVEQNRHQTFFAPGFDERHFPVILLAYRMRHATQYSLQGAKLPSGRLAQR